jgi:hypothetical protein
MERGRKPDHGAEPKILMLFIDSLPGDVEQVTEEQSLEVTKYDIDLDYDYWTAGNRFAIRSRA